MIGHDHNERSPALGMPRQDVIELLDDPTLPADVVAGAYRGLARTHRWLGNVGAILRRLRRGTPRARSVLDLGCGHGALLTSVRDQLGMTVLGFDLRPPPANAPVQIRQGDAVVDVLPRADVALAVCLVHHLTPIQVVSLIHNVARSCKRLIVLDLVRHRLPLLLFRALVAPFLRRINAADGATSIRRAFTTAELRALVDEAVRGTNASVRHTVTPFFTRQIVDITF
jgi:2-polyprenyl-3-methyl-5-hydroxy-6-metoxy-1,4-benzoquinol methylase